MRKNVFILLIVSLALGFTACNKVKTDTSSNSDFAVDNDLAALQQRLVIYNEPLNWSNTNKSSQALGDLTLEWNLMPHVFAITDDGNLDADYLSASSVAERYDAVNGEHVYVGFHDRASQFYGEVVQVDPANGDREAYVSGAVYSNLVDVNDIEIAGDFLYVAGESYKRGAEALKMAINTSSGVLSAPVTVGMPIWGVSANSVTKVGDELWVSSGGSNDPNMEGGLAVLDLVGSADPNFLVLQDNGKHFDADGDFGLWIQGNNASETNMYIFQTLTAPSTRFDWYTVGTGTVLPKLDAPVTAYGKNAVDVDGTYAYVAMGAAGVYKVDLSVGATTGNYVKYFDPANLGFANGVATDGTYVYVANGSDGLIVLNATTMTEVGRWNGTTTLGTYDSNGSCNFVAVGEPDGTDVILYVAFGRGGLVKLRMSTT